MTQLVSTPANTVLMVQQGGTSQYAWVVYLPNGTILNTSGSTTDGLQEAIDYAIEYGYNLHITGLMIIPGSWPPPFNPTINPGIGYGTINYSTPIKVPAIQGGKWRFDSLTFNYTGAAETTWTWDSTELFELESIGCQWVGSTGIGQPLMLWQPTNPWPQDPYGPAIESCSFRMGAFAQTGEGVCVRLDAANAPVNNSYFDFGELNGGGFGLVIYGGTHGVAQNIIRCPFVHSNTTEGVAVGLTTADQNSITGNTIVVKMESPPTAVGIDIWSSNNVIDVSVIGSGGAPLIAVKLEASAANNTITCGLLQGATLLDDLSGASSGNLVVGAGARGTSVLNAAKGVIYHPDSTMEQWINTAGSSTAGVTTDWQVPFRNAIFAWLAVPTNQQVAFEAVGSTSGITITVASGTPSFSVWARGR